MEEIGRHCRNFLGIETALEMKILNDGVNQLWLCQLNGSVSECLHLYAQEVTDVAFVIYSESVGACTQVRADGID